MKLRILLFEDEETVRTFIGRILAHRDYELICYDDPRRCELLQSSKCECPEGFQCTDVIMCDRYFHGRDCMDFIRKQKERGCKARFIAILSAVVSWDEREWAEENCIEVFTKPFRTDTILDWLTDCESKSDPERQLIGVDGEVLPPWVIDQ